MKRKKKATVLFIIYLLPIVIVFAIGYTIGVIKWAYREGYKAVN